jgi:toxin CcdB
MSKYDVFPAPTKNGTGYVIDVQADLLSNLSTRAVVPLQPSDVAPKPAHELNPAFEINGQTYLMLTQFIATVPAKELKKSVLSLDHRRDDITRALDVLLTGF